MQSNLSKLAEQTRRARGIALLRAEPELDNHAMMERFGVDVKSIDNWRAEAQKTERSKTHRRAKRRPRRLL
jgi:phage-related protein